MDFRVLGVLEVVHEGRVLDLGRPKQRALLARLLIEPNTVVSVDRLAEDLWEEKPPDDPAAALQPQVSRMRRALATAAAGRPLIVRRRPGYALCVEPEELDAWRFEKAVAVARTALARGDAAVARATLTTALSLWRGPALADVAYASFAQSEITRLEELRLAAIEMLVEARLALGHHHELLGELESLVAAHPLRERLRGQRILALYRCGRQADALRAYQDVRATLGEELGLDPGPELQDLELAILRQDPALAWMPSGVGGGGDGGRPAIPAARVGRSATGEVTSFVGREAECRQLAATITSTAGPRVVTLTGPPGSGKSRLARHTLATLSPLPPGGTWRVDLSSATAPVHVARAVAGELGLEVADALGLGRALGGRHLILVIDNCDHLLGACVDLARSLLEQCPDVRLLFTSREPLGLEGEAVWAVGPLSVPRDAAAFDEIRQSEAVRLFVDRAEAVAAGFELTPSNAAAVATLCRRLDGLPLALELAASRVEALTPARMAEDLVDQLEAEAQGGLAQSLAGTLRWSHDLLSAPERVLLRRLSVFSGSASLQAVEDVCGGGDLSPSLVVESLTRLVAKSLVMAETVGNEIRYRLLETVSRFARERLVEARETSVLRERHGEWAASLAERVERELAGGSQRMWLERLDLEQANIRTALESSVVDRRPDVALRLGAHLCIYWMARGSAEALEPIDHALEMAPDSSPLLRAKGCWAVAALATMAGSCSTALPRLTEGIDLARQTGDQRVLARLLVVLGQCSLVSPNPLAAVPPLEEASHVARHQGDSWCLVQALVGWGQAVERRGHVEAARGLFEESVAVAQAAADAHSNAMGLTRLGRLALGEGDNAAAESYLRDALGLARELGNRYAEAEALGLLGEVVARQGAHERARDLLGLALDLARQLGSPSWAVAAPLDALGRLAQAEGDVEGARSFFTEALSVLRAAEMPHLGPLLGLAEVAHATGDFVEAGAILEEVSKLARADNDNQAMARTLLGFARLSRAEGDMGPSTTYARDAMKLWATSGNRVGGVLALEELARLAVTQGDGEGAARLFGAAQVLREAGGHQRPPAEAAGYDRDVAAARASVNPEQFEAAWKAGSRLSWEQIVEWASSGSTMIPETPAPSAVAGSEVGRRYRPVVVASPDPQPRGRWGDRLAAAGDLDGDGVADLVVGVPGFDLGLRRDVGRVHVLSGRGLAAGRADVTHVIDCPDPAVGGRFGFALRVAGDVDGDGIDDLAVGSYQQDRVWMFSGANGRHLFTIDNPHRSSSGGWSGFGSRLGVVGDINGDGVPDLGVGSPGLGNGEAFVFCGRTGRLLRAHHLPADDAVEHAKHGRAASWPALFGLSLQGPGDVDGDGVPDVVVSAPGFDRATGRMYVFSGANGQLISRIDSPEPQIGGYFGFQDVAPLTPGDVDGDGHADVYGNGFRQQGQIGPDEGRAWVLDGRSGRPLYALVDPAPSIGGQFGWSVARGPDGELYVGSAPHHLPGATQNGGTAVFCAKDGSTIAALGLPVEYVQPGTPTNWGPNLGWSIAAPGDLDGDGVADYVASAPFLDVGGDVDQGLLFVFLSRVTG